MDLIPDFFREIYEKLVYGLLCCPTVFIFGQAGQKNQGESVHWNFIFIRTYTSTLAFKIILIILFGLICVISTKICISKVLGFIQSIFGKVNITKYQINRKILFFSLVKKNKKKFLDFKRPSKMNCKLHKISAILH